MASPTEIAVMNNVFSKAGHESHEISHFSDFPFSSSSLEFTEHLNELNRNGSSCGFGILERDGKLRRV